MSASGDVHQEFDDQAAETIQAAMAVSSQNPLELRVQGKADLSICEEQEDQALPDCDDRYLLESRIGEGGMGTVYKAKHLLLNRPVAIKVLSNASLNSPKAVMRFQQEAKAATALSHEHIASVKEFGVSKDGLPFLAMDYVSGLSLAQLLKEERLAPKRAVDVFIQVCEGMVHAHKRGILHRDLKPANILLTEEDNRQDFVKIVDFGIAKIMPVGEQESVSLTKTGELFGTPLYMSPEQCQGLSVDQRTDIYNMGCVMYEVLTGSPPFSAQNSARLMYSQIFDLPKPFANQETSNKKLVQALENVVLRCLEKDPALRYQSMDALLAALKLVEQGGTPGAGISQSTKRKQKLFKIALLCAVSLSLLVISFISFPFAKNAFFPPVWIQTEAEAATQSRINSLGPAEALLKRALSQAEAGNANNLDKFKIYYDLGNVYLNSAQYTSAVDAFKSALPLIKATNQPLDTGNALELLAYATYCTHLVDYVFVNSEQALSDCRHGIELTTEALKLKQSVVGAEHSYLSYTLVKRAKLYEAIADYKNAEADWKRAIEIDKKSPTTRARAAQELESLARSFAKAGNKAAAGKSYSEAIELTKEVYGADSSYVQKLEREIENYEQKY